MKLNLLSPIGLTFGAAYENVTSTETSVQVSFLVSEFGFAVTPEFRYYLSEKSYAPTGFYVAPFLQYSEYDDGSELGAGLVIGGQRLFKEKISVDWYFGPSYNSVFFNEVVVLAVRTGLLLGLNLTGKGRGA